MHEQGKSQFSDIEREEMATLARQIAQLGPEALHDLAGAKVRLCAIAHKMVDSVSDIDQKLNLARAFHHEVEVVSETLRQVRAIRQFQGIDELSQLDRAAQEAGMGSIFDEKSEIYQKLKGLL